MQEKKQELNHAVEKTGKAKLRYTFISSMFLWLSILETMKKSFLGGKGQGSHFQPYVPMFLCVSPIVPPIL